MKDFKIKAQLELPVELQEILYEGEYIEIEDILPFKLVDINSELEKNFINKQNEEL